MKRSLLFGCICAFGATLFAQEDPTIMRINGKEVSRSEFEYSYRCHTSDLGTKVTPKEYAEHFVTRKLKVAAARAVGIDTVAAFRKQQEGFRSVLLKSYLTDERLEDSCARARYYQMKTSGRTGQVQMMQIFKSLPQTATTRRLQAELAAMDSIYLAIKNQPELDFAHLVDRFSDDKRCMWLKHLQTTSEVEDIAFSLGKGEVSKPFLSSAGIHLVKVVDRQEFPDYETMRPQLLDRTKRVWGLDKATETVVERLKKEYQYTVNPAGMEELLAVGETEKTLFTIDGKAFTGKVFKRFADSYPQAVKRQLNGFIAKSLLDYENQNMANKHPDSYNAIREKEEEALVTQLTRQKIESPVLKDRAALATFFKFHQSDYRWESPRYKGVVLHCVDKKTTKQAKKLLKRTPQKEWVDVLRKTFNTPEEEKIKVEQGIFANGDNKYVDKLVFKKADFEPIVSYPFTVVVGEKLKGPEDYQLVIERVQKDYQTHLDACWTRELKESGKVEINQEVLKTVNND